MTEEQRQVYYNSALLNLQNATKTDRFSSKEELNQYIEGMKKNGMPESILSEEKKKELLDLYDEYHKTEQVGLDTQNYKGTNLNEQNYIVSTQNDTVLKTNESNTAMIDEFKKTQNELSSASNSNSLANANTVYNHLKDTKKEEVDLVPLYEVIERSNISVELLGKIKFFISNKYINPYSFKVSPETGVFYNTETSELLEVVKDESTGKYVIKKGGEIIYREDSQSQEMTSSSLENNSDNQEKEKDTNEEEQLYDYTKKEGKIRVLAPPKPQKGFYYSDSNRAAFVKASFLIVTTCLVSIGLAMLLLLLK